jgi:hypothetical protein
MIQKRPPISGTDNTIGCSERVQRVDVEADHRLVRCVRERAVVRELVDRRTRTLRLRHVRKDADLRVDVDERKAEPERLLRQTLCLLR